MKIDEKFVNKETSEHPDGWGIKHTLIWKRLIERRFIWAKAPL
jgi:hypothetical protein